jgi:glycosyltransferase involved in cell wall biosynthesis
MILMVHGYGLTGSGSNLWTRSVVAALCEQGQTVHLCCQERRPEQFDFIREVIDYDEEGRPAATLTSDGATSGGCVLHRPSIDVLPTFVRPSAGAKGMKAIVDMSEESVEDYLQRNERALKTIIESHDIAAVQVNHVVLMSEAVRRATRVAGRPFAVMPHGSAIEYVVKQNEAMHALASSVLDAADRVLVLNDEMRGRITDVFGELGSLEDKMIHVPVGVDVRKFKAVNRSERQAAIDQLKDRLEHIKRGRNAEHDEILRSAVRADPDFDGLKESLDRAGDYPQRNPDSDLEDKLDSIDWAAAPVVGYVGRLLGHKGVHALLAAFPLILQKHPEASLVVAGSGPLREWLEAFRYALAAGNLDLARQLSEWGGALEGEGKQFDHVTHFLDGLDDDERRAYSEFAKRLAEPGRVVMTGYLDHAELSLLFGCLDVGVFPSIVREASPLVVPEAMASGVFPIGTYQGGMASSLDHAAMAIPEALREMMRLRPEPENMAVDIAKNVSSVIDARLDKASEFHTFAAEHYDWQKIAMRMSDDLEQLSAHLN